MTLYIIGVDPGDSTGVALLKDAELVYALQTVETGTAIDALHVILGKVTADDEAVIACERYIQTRRGPITNQPRAQQIFGVVQRIAEEYGVRFFSQGPADAKAIASNELLRGIGMLKTGNDVGQPDANDVNMAIRHALFALARVRATLFETLITRTR